MGYKAISNVPGIKRGASAYVSDTIDAMVRDWKKGGCGTMSFEVFDQEDNEFTDENITEWVNRFRHFCAKKSRSIVGIRISVHKREKTKLYVTIQKVV